PSNSTGVLRSRRSSCRCLKGRRWTRPSGPSGWPPAFQRSTEVFAAPLAQEARKPIISRALPPRSPSNSHHSPKISRSRYTQQHPFDALSRRKPASVVFVPRIPICNMKDDSFGHDQEPGPPPVMRKQGEDRMDTALPKRPSAADQDEDVAADRL